MNPTLQDLEQAIGYEFQDPVFIERALTHPSYRNENGALGDNQRLEFLGDAVLGLLAAGYLLHRFRRFQEGELTRLRSGLTNSKTLARMARRIGLGSYLKLGRGEQRTGGARKPSILADAMESLFGAVYEDGGLGATRCLFEKLVVPELEDILENAALHNPKGTLQEYAQRRCHTRPEYTVTENGGPCHAPCFHARVMIHDVVYGLGAGATKQAAEKDAARQAIASLLSSAEDASGLEDPCLNGEAVPAAEPNPGNAL